MLKVEIGLFDRMVLQRNGLNVCDTVFVGSADCDGGLYATVTQKGKTLKGFCKIQVGKVIKGAFKGRLKGLPVGGSYDIQLTVGSDSLTVRDVLVGDVWILGGQSNMEGYGAMEPSTPKNKMVRAFYMDDHWDVAKDPLHQLSIAVDFFHNQGNRQSVDTDKSPCRRGPGLSFGQEMFKETGVPQGLIACAHGGTSMSQWSPTLKKHKGKSLYGATLRRFEKNGSKVAGIVWYQGCSDADQENAPKYSLRMKRLISAFRRDFKNSKLPFVLVQIARVARVEEISHEPWNSIQEQQRLLAEKIDNCVTVPAVDLPLEDPIHISGAGQLVVGKRLADAMLALTRKIKGHKKPIEFVRFRLISDKCGWGCVKIEVSFKNVVGCLQACGVPSGFSLSKPDGKSIDGIYKIEPKGNKILLHSQVPIEILNILQSRLHYGHGCMPHCNITDSADRSLPVFGPIQLSQLQAATPFVLDYFVSDVIPYSDDPTKMPYPDFEKNQSAWKKKRFDNMWFAERHQELMQAPESIVYYLTDMVCPKDMSGELLVGYDGPVKVWLNRKNIIQDMAGTNPGKPDKSKIKLSLKKGKTYRIVIALNSNQGKAFGISLRFRRYGVSKAKLSKGAEYYSLPKFFLADIR